MKKNKNLIMSCLDTIKDIFRRPTDTIEDIVYEKRPVEASVAMVLVIIIIGITAGAIGNLISTVGYDFTIRDINWSQIVFGPMIIVSGVAFLTALVYLIAFSVMRKEVDFGQLLYISAYSQFPIIFFSSLFVPIIGIYSFKLAIIPFVIGAVNSIFVLIYSMDFVVRFEELKTRFQFQLFTISIILFTIIFVAIENINRLL